MLTHKLRQELKDEAFHTYDVEFSTGWYDVVYQGPLEGGVNLFVYASMRDLDVHEFERRIQREITWHGAKDALLLTTEELVPLQFEGHLRALGELRQENCGPYLHYLYTPRG